MFKCDTCKNSYRCKLPEKYTEESEICDCYESNEPDDDFDEAADEELEETQNEEIEDIFNEELEEEIS